MLLVGVNSKYIHSCLSIRYMAKKDTRLSFCEFTISHEPGKVAASLFSTGKQSFLFSCYIWNIEFILKVCEVLKKANPNCFLVLGGPEVSFNPEERLQDNPFIDGILTGEGEMSVSSLYDAVKTGDFSSVPGLYYRENTEIIRGIPCPEASPSQWPFPYDEEDIKGLKNRIVYYETSRGCPYRCAFCLSGGAGSLRFLPVERVEQELMFFEQHKVPLVKLVDRTFNADPGRAHHIIEGIKQRNGDTRYHFEIRAESMTEELINSLQTAPKGMFQLEIGVQSTDNKTLSNIDRKADFDRLSYVVLSLLKNGNLHLHLDLIAGLPGETLDTFLQSFHQVITLRPHKLQLGFLKKLHGATLSAKGSHFCSYPPYEVISSDAMSYEDILLLKSGEETLERYYNSGVFSTTMAYILEKYYAGKEFTFFLDMAVFIGDANPKSQKTAYEDLYNFGITRFNDPKITECLIFDYCSCHKDSLSFMKGEQGLKEKAFNFLKQPHLVAQYFDDYTGIKPVQLYKIIRFVPIGGRVYAFDYQKGRSTDVTKEFTLEE